MAGTIVYLLRHGATAANREVAVSITRDGPSISPSTGRASNRHGARARRCEVIVSRPSTRAPCSAPSRLRPGSALPHGLEPIAVEGLIEADLGRWEGLTWDQARAADPEHHEAFIAHPGTVPYPGGESFRDAQNRMVPTIAELVARHPGERIAVVSHNVTNRAYLAALMGIPIDRAREIRQANGGISVIRYEGGRRVVETLNGRFHLDEIVY